MHFRHTIDSPGPLYSDIRSWVARRAISKGANGAWAEQLQLISSTQLDDIVKSIDVDLERFRYVLFSDGTEKSAEMNDPVDVVVHYDGLQVLVIKDIRIDKWS